MLADTLKVSGWDVLAYEPLTLNTTPCYVVGRPNVDFNGNALAEMRVPIWAMGRRLGDEESSMELDRGLDVALDLLSAVSVVRGVFQTMATFDVLTYPAYRIDVVLGHGLC